MKMTEPFEALDALDTAVFTVLYGMGKGTLRCNKVRVVVAAEGVSFTKRRVLITLSRVQVYSLELPEGSEVR